MFHRACCGVPTRPGSGPGALQRFCMSAQSRRKERRRRGTSRRRHLPGIHSLPRLPPPRPPCLDAAHRTARVHNKHPGTGRGRSQEVTGCFRPRCSDTCRCANGSAGDVPAPDTCRDLGRLCTKKKKNNTQYLLSIADPALPPRPDKQGQLLSL